MKKFIIVLLVAVPMTLSAAGVANKTLGAGINVGEPFGLNARYFFSPQFVGDLTLGYGFVAERSYVLVPSALFYLRDIFTLDTDTISLVPYLGFGFKFGVDTFGIGNDFIAAMRVPFGFAIVMMDGKFEVSGEYGSGFRFTPNAGYDYTGGLGLRFYFM
jgi:hypothetical protein